MIFICLIFFQWSCKKCPSNLLIGNWQLTEETIYNIKTTYNVGNQIVFYECLESCNGFIHIRGQKDSSLFNYSFNNSSNSLQIQIVGSQIVSNRQILTLTSNKLILSDTSNKDISTYTKSS